MRVRFVHLRRHIDVSAAMPAPRKVEEMMAWFKSARKACDKIPALFPETTWKIARQHATPERVVFELRNEFDQHDKRHDFCHVVINRLASSLG